MILSALVWGLIRKSLVKYKLGNDPHSRFTQPWLVIEWQMLGQIIVSNRFLDLQRSRDLLNLGLETDTQILAQITAQIFVWPTDMDLKMKMSNGVNLAQGFLGAVDPLSSLDLMI